MVMNWNERSGTVAKKEKQETNECSKSAATPVQRKAMYENKYTC